MKTYLRELFQFNSWSTSALLLFLASVFVLANDSANRFVKSFFAPPEREVLSVAAGDLFGTGKVNRVMKILTPEAIVIEVYDGLEDHGRRLIQSIQLPDRRDGRYHLFGQAISLALKDMDGDRRPEIVAPTYDSEMRPRLNVFKFNKEIQQFEPYTGAAP